MKMIRSKVAIIYSFKFLLTFFDNKANFICQKSLNLHGYIKIFSIFFQLNKNIVLYWKQKYNF